MSERKPVIMEPADTKSPPSKKYTGYFASELKTCSTIEEALKSFDDTAEKRKSKFKKKKI